MENNQTGNHNQNLQGNGNFANNSFENSTVTIQILGTGPNEGQKFTASSKDFLSIADSWLSILSSVFGILGITGGFWIWNIAKNAWNATGGFLIKIGEALGHNLDIFGLSFPLVPVLSIMTLLSFVVAISFHSAKKFARSYTMKIFWKQTKYFIAGYKKGNKNRIGLFKVNGDCIRCFGSKKGKLRAKMIPLQKLEVRDSKTAKLISSKPIKESGFPALVCSRNPEQHIYKIDRTNYEYEVSN